MRRGSLLLLLLDLVLGLALVVFGVRVAERGAPVRLELGRVRRTTLDAATRARLARLDDRVFLTYYVSPRAAMPSHLRRVERDVTEVLEALRRASAGRLEYLVVDPSSDPDLAGFAARRRVTPLRVRHVRADRYSEQEIWSTLTIAYGARRPVRLEGLGVEHLPRLVPLLVAHLDALEEAPVPVFAFAAPAGFEKLRATLAARGVVRDVDLAGNAPLPADADLLLLLDPGEISPARLEDLRRFLRRGRSAIVAGSTLQPAWDGTPGNERLLLRPSEFEAEVLWGAFGLRPVPGLVLDARHAQLGTAEEPLAAPFRIACIANNQDFHALAFEPNGNLLFVAPTPWVPDGEALAAEGWSLDVLATTSDQTWIQAALPEVPLADMGPEHGVAVPKQPLVVWLRPNDPWRGSLIGLAASTPFRDEVFDIGGVAHPRLAKVLLDTLASDERVIVSRAEIAGPTPLPALSAPQRLGWRAFCLLALPLAFGGVVLVRSLRRGSRRVGQPALPVLAAGALLAAGLSAGVAALGRASGLAGRLDLSDERLNTLHPVSAALAAGARGESSVRAEFLVSSHARLPPSLRPLVGRLRDLLGDLRRAGAELSLSVVHPEDLDEGPRAQLERDGVHPVRVASSDEEVTTVRTVWCSLRLSSGARTEVLPFDDLRAAEYLEFRLAFALWRLASGEAPHLALASDVPRLSAAEAHEHYQTKGLIAPLGKDVYSQARTLLEGLDFRVTHVNPREPVLPPDVDALLWLQPRRPVGAMLAVLAEHLYRGGSAFLAVQHFNVQRRQYRGTGFEFVHWPQPQSPDVELYWLPELGVELVRQVLFDESSFALEEETQITRAARRDFQRTRSALPIQIRGLAAHFDPTSVVTSHLGDQPMLWANWLALDSERLTQLGLTARTLIATSPRTWSLDWKGGWIPNELLEGPPRDAAGVPQYLGPLPLAVLLEGTFPWPTKPFERAGPILGEDGLPRPAEEVASYSVPEPAGSHAPGRLLVVGCSEAFKDSRLAELAPTFRADHLLANAACALALPEDLAEVAARRPVSRGFLAPHEGGRLRWRAAVLLGLPAGYLLAGLLRRLRAGAPPHATRGGRS